MAVKKNLGALFRFGGGVGTTEIGSPGFWRQMNFHGSLCSASWNLSDLGQIIQSLGLSFFLCKMTQLRLPFVLLWRWMHVTHSALLLSQVRWPAINLSESSDDILSFLYWKPSDFPWVFPPVHIGPRKCTSRSLLYKKKTNSFNIHLANMEMRSLWKCDSAMRVGYRLYRTKITRHRGLRVWGCAGSWLVRDEGRVMYHIFRSRGQLCLISWGRSLGVVSP